MPRVSIGDCHLHIERQGAGFPVIFVTGLGGLGSYWRDQLPAFTRSFDVITYDHRGIGQSDPALSCLTVERLAADVIALMDALRLPKAHIVGHSTGGAVAQVLAIEHPKRCASVVIAASWARADAYFRRLFALRKEILCRLGPASYLQASTLFLYPATYITRNNERLRQAEAQMLANFPLPDVVTARIDAVLAFDRSEELSRVRTPALIISAQDDLVTPAYYSEELARRIPAAELKLFPEGGHYFTQVACREFNQAVLPFLGAHTPAGGSAVPSATIV